MMQLVESNSPSCLTKATFFSFNGLEVAINRLPTGQRKLLQANHTSADHS